MVRSHPNDKPWMTPHIKDLILQRQQAFSSSDHRLWRNKVAGAIASSKQSYYTNRVSHLKSSVPSRWWKQIKQLHGKSSSFVNFTISYNGSILSDTRLPDFLNQFFASVSDDFTPLDYCTLPAFLPAPKQLPVLSVYEVKSKVANIKGSKDAGPDGILNRVLREFSDELAYPITEWFNRSFEFRVLVCFQSRGNNHLYHLYRKHALYSLKTTLDLFLSPPLCQKFKKTLL